MITRTGMPQATADAFRSGALDANGQRSERHVSDGGGNPCRCCMRYIPKGQPMLVLSYRPFETVNPYAESGPVFICAKPCRAPTDSSPEVLTTPLDFLVKAYGRDERIIYGTGQIIPTDGVMTYAAKLLDRLDVAFVDMRSSRNNCWAARIARG